MYVKSLLSCSPFVVCHHNSFNIFRTLKKQTMQEWEKVSKGSLFTAWVLCMVLALAGYLSFFSEVRVAH